MSSYALSGLLSLFLLAINTKGFFGPDYYICPQCQKTIVPFIWIMFFTIPYAIFFSFLLCWDKIEYINNILKIKGIRSKKIINTRLRSLYNIKRKTYFTVFIVFYIILWIVYRQYILQLTPFFTNTPSNLVYFGLLVFGLLGLCYLHFNTSEYDAGIDDCPLLFDFRHILEYICGKTSVEIDQKYVPKVILKTNKNELKKNVHKYIVYDYKRERLVFKGIMTNLILKNLLKESRNLQYKTKIKELFQKSQYFKCPKIFKKGMWLWYTLVTTVVIYLLSVILSLSVTSLIIALVVIILLFLVIRIMCILYHGYSYRRYKDSIDKRISKNEAVDSTK
ncbi:MAG: hypothetical protein NUV40_03190 [Patescibacteria group bacterium]|nr:hypothetical protein [Patescibacteria group bacterium]